MINLLISKEYLTTDAINFALSLSLIDNQEKNIFFMNNAVKLLFSENINNLIKNNNDDYLKSWKLLAFEEINNIYIDRESLQKFNLNIENSYFFNTHHNLILLTQNELITKFIQGRILKQF